MSREVCGICWCPYDEDTGECACKPEPKAQHMTTLRTAAQQALDALVSQFDGRADAIDILSAALAQQAEPVADLRCAKWLDPECADKGACQSLRFKRQAAQEQAEQAEPVAGVAENATTQQQIEQTPPSDYRRGYWAGFAIGKREGHIEAEDAAKQAEPVRVPVQQPYCYVYEYDGAFGLHREFYPKVYNGHKPDRTVPLYTSPPQQAEPVEPVAWVRLEAWKSGKDWPDDCFTALPAEGLTPLYTAPPQRKPLTEEEIDALDLPPSGTATVRDLVRLIERAHGITP